MQDPVPVLKEILAVLKEIRDSCEDDKSKLKRLFGK